MSKEVMQQALEALKVSVPVILGNFSRHSKAIAALEALAEQPAQQVVDCHATGVCVQSGLRAEQPHAFGTLAQQEPLQNNPFDCGVYLGSGKDYAIKHHVSYGPAQQEPVAWMYPEGLEALKNGKPWTAYGTKQEANNIALYLHPTPEREPYAWVTFTPYGDEDDVWYENPEGKLLEGWTYKPLYDATPLQSTWVDLTEAEIDEICLGDEAKVRTALQLLKEKNT